MCKKVKAANAFPAVIVGGPPHSGKSVLVYSLTQALRRANIAHYVLRACPDYEGDWANEIPQEQVQIIRQKGAFTAEFTAAVQRSQQRWQLPCLVGVCGQPTPAQQATWRYATHALLLVAAEPAQPEKYTAQMDWWQTIMTTQRLPLIGQIQSQLQGKQQLITTTPLVTGIITGLERGRLVEGPVIAALTAKLSTLFTYSEDALAAIHLADAPVELALNLPSLANTLGGENGRWHPTQLPALLAYLPTDTPLAVYGRAPHWIYAALAALAQPAPLWLFDARLGWMQPPTLPVTAAAGAVQAGWQVVQTTTATYTHLALSSRAQFLRPEAPSRLPLPPIDSSKGLILSGKIPNWLLTAVVYQFPTVPWLAVYQPFLAGAVVVASQTPNEVGRVLPLAVG